EPGPEDPADGVALLVERAATLVGLDLSDAGQDRPVHLAGGGLGVQTVRGPVVGVERDPGDPQRSVGDRRLPDVRGARIGLLRWWLFGRGGLRWGWRLGHGGHRGP